MTSRDVINTKITATLDTATDKWGSRSTGRAENILPPREIQDAMEKQMKAERERREAILSEPREKSAARSWWQKVKKNLRFCGLRRKNRLQSCMRMQ